ncbi:DUF7260 family protein, partial [Halococcus salifodinae]
MATRFAPTHVRSAIAVVETDHERTITERDAFARFADCVSEFEVSSVDLHPDHAQQAPAQTLVAPETAARAKSPLARVRDAYRDTVMGVPHYDEEYDDSLPESLTGEFSPEVAAAVLTSEQLTPHLRDRLIDATHRARESRR